MPGMQYAIKIKTFSMNAVKLLDETNAREPDSMPRRHTYLILNGYLMQCNATQYTTAKHNAVVLCK